MTNSKILIGSIELCVFSVAHTNWACTGVPFSMEKSLCLLVALEMLAVTMYSKVLNKRRVWNKRTGGKIHKKQ